MERDAKRCFWAGLTAALICILHATLFNTGEAFAQPRYSGYARVWSSAAGIAGKRVLGRPLPPAPAQTLESYGANQDSPQQTAGNPQARAALRYDWSAAAQEESDVQASAGVARAPLPNGVQVELFIDHKTDKALRQMSAEMGIPYSQALSEFLRVSSTIYTERLLCTAPR